MGQDRINRHYREHDTMMRNFILAVPTEDRVIRHHEIDKDAVSRPRCGTMVQSGSQAAGGMGVTGAFLKIWACQPVSIREKSWNLHYAAAGEAVELFDLENDPGQERNVASDHGDVVERLHGRFVEHLRECPTVQTHLRERERL